jgi:hypothetical protein
MFMIDLHTTYYMPRSNGLLIIPVKQRARANFRTSAILSFHFNKNVTQTLFQDLL